MFSVLKYMGHIVFQCRYAILVLVLLNGATLISMVSGKIIVLVLFLSLLVIVNQVGKVFRRADRMENDLTGDAKLRVERGRPSIHSHGL